ncbi:uncharacterized protein LOC108665180 isoform X2 [Hyalella azteca]|uniref:Uncharacterized protein LOC108665180 isoform X2 n=1 Tax=Hyalella azteca TaxID=294128 RepID=A0A8B7N1H2_HYAAZ|nr:uncharacterized protein LOC108665180 isoform X2 [Hyalella azteca]
MFRRTNGRPPIYLIGGLAISVLFLTISYWNLNTQNNDVLQSLEKMQASLKIGEIKIEQSEKKAAALQDQLRESKDQNEQQENKLILQEQEIKNFNSDLRKREYEISSLRDEAEGLQGKLREADIRIGDCESESGRLTRENDLLISQRDDAVSALGKRDEQIIELNRKLQMERECNKQLDANLSAMNRQLASSSARLSQLQERNGRQEPQLQQEGHVPKVAVDNRHNSDTGGGEVGEAGHDAGQEVGVVARPEAPDAAGGDRQSDAALEEKDGNAVNVLPAPVPGVGVPVLGSQQDAVLPAPGVRSSKASSPSPASPSSLQLPHAAAAPQDVALLQPVSRSSTRGANALLLNPHLPLQQNGGFIPPPPGAKHDQIHLPIESLRMENMGNQMVIGRNFLKAVPNVPINRTLPLQYHGVDLPSDLQPPVYEPPFVNRHFEPLQSYVHIPPRTFDHMPPQDKEELQRLEELHKLQREQQQQYERHQQHRLQQPHDATQSRVNENFGHLDNFVAIGQDPDKNARKPLPRDAIDLSLYHNRADYPELRQAVSLLRGDRQGRAADLTGGRRVLTGGDKAPAHQPPNDVLPPPPDFSDNLDAAIDEGEPLGDDPLMPDQDPDGGDGAPNDEALQDHRLHEDRVHDEALNRVARAAAPRKDGVGPDEGSKGMMATRGGGGLRSGNGAKDEKGSRAGSELEAGNNVRDDNALRAVQGAQNSGVEDAGHDLNKASLVDKLDQNLRGDKEEDDLQVQDLIGDRKAAGNEFFANVQGASVVKAADVGDEADDVVGERQVIEDAAVDDEPELGADEERVDGFGNKLGKESFVDGAGDVINKDKGRAGDVDYHLQENVGESPNLGESLNAPEGEEEEGDFKLEPRREDVPIRISA